MKTVIGIMLLTLAANAYALGEREEAILKFLGGVFIIEKIAEASEEDDGHYHGEEWHYHKYDYDGHSHRHHDEVMEAYEKGRRDRARAEHKKRVREAYRCGRYLDCD